MRFEPLLQQGILLQRYKRFLADIAWPDGQVMTVHCPNPGAMTGCAEPGWAAALSYDPNPRRKLPYTLEMVFNGDSWIGVNTQRANQIVAEALESSRIPELNGYTILRREVRYGTKSRVDFLLSEPNRPDCYLEVKSVTWVEQGINRFPDAVTQRGLRHLHELMAMKAQGQRAVLLFVVQRNDGKGFEAAADVDPAYARALTQAQAAGVEVLVYQADLAPSHWVLGHSLQL